MVKALGDLCLGCIQQHLSSIPQLGASLPTLYKERLIERLAYHDMLHKSYLPQVSYNLFCAALRHVKLYKCPQVDDQFLALLADCKCQLEVLVINGCGAVTGNCTSVVVFFFYLFSSKLYTGKPVVVVMNEAVLRRSPIVPCSLLCTVVASGQKSLLSCCSDNNDNG